MAFADIGAIKPYTDSWGGTYFALFSRADLYQRNPPRISPRYLPKHQAQFLEFEKTTLPRLKILISSNMMQKSTHEAAADERGLVYFTNRNGVYQLNAVYARDKRKWTAVGVMFLTFLFVMGSPSLRLTHLNLGLGAGLGALLVGFLMTERKLFSSGFMYSELAGGLFRKAYTLRQFRTFEVMHRRVNFIYVDTDVNLVFDIGNQQSVVFLCQMKQTKHIETLLNEVRFIIAQQMAPN